MLLIVRKQVYLLSTAYFKVSLRSVCGRECLEFQDCVSQRMHGMMLHLLISSNSVCFICLGGRGIVQGVACSVCNVVV